MDRPEATVASHGSTASDRGDAPARRSDIVVLRLECRRSSHPAVTFQVRRGGELLIGRTGAGTSDLEIHDETVSQRHARITWREEGLLLEDLGSKNGTWCNRIPLRSGESMPLAAESRIDLGKASFRVRLPGADEALRAEVVGRSIDARPSVDGVGDGDTIDLHAAGGRTLTVMMDAVGSGDTDERNAAIVSIAEFYEPWVRSYVERRVCPALKLASEHADEIAQRTWRSILVTLQNGFDYERAGSFRSWLATACHNHGKKFLDDMCREGRNLGDRSPMHDGISAPEIDLSAWDEYQKQLVVHAVEKVRKNLWTDRGPMSDVKRAVLERYVLPSHAPASAKELAAEFGKTRENIRKIAERLREDLQREYHRLDEKFGEPPVRDD